MREQNEIKLSVERLKKYSPREIPCSFIYLRDSYKPVIIIYIGNKRHTRYIILE